MPLPNTMDRPASPQSQPFAAGSLYWPRQSITPVLRFRGLMLLGVIFFQVLLFAVPLDFVRKYFLLCFVVPVLCDIYRWFLLSTGEPRTLLIHGPITGLWLLLVGLPAAACFFGGLAWWTTCMVTIATVATLWFGSRLEQHYTAYLLDHHHLSERTRAKWREALADPTSHRQLDSAKTLDDDAKKSFAECRGAFFSSTPSASIAFFSVIAFSLINFRIADVPDTNHSPAYLAPLCFLFAVPALLFLFHLFSDRHPFPISQTFQALLNFLYSPPDVNQRDGSSWTATSPCGPQEQRTNDLWWTCGVIAATLLPAVVFSPLLNADDYAYYRWVRNPHPSYPVYGSYALLPSLFMPFARWLFLLFLVVVVSPFYFFTLLTTAFGPSLEAGQRLFENADALEHAEAELYPGVDAEAPEP